MLDYDLLPRLLGFGLAEKGYRNVIILYNDEDGRFERVVATDDAEQAAHYTRNRNRFRAIRSMPNSEQGRMRHAMSGRLS